MSLEWMDFSLAARNGHLECLKYLHENGLPWGTWTCCSAAFGGHLKCLKYLHENGCPWDEGTCSQAAKYGRLECLKYLVKTDVLGIRDLFCCCLRGQLECLKYLHENGCPWDYRTCDNAAKYYEWYDNLECFKYAHENGCPGSSSHSYLLF